MNPTMNPTDFILLLPILILAGTSVLLLLIIPFYRSHPATAAITALGFAGAMAVIPRALSAAPRKITDLLAIDGFSLLFTGLICAAGFMVTLLCHENFRTRWKNPEEIYILLLLASLGSVILVSSHHFASLFLGLEILSVSLYSMIAYERDRLKSIEAGIKYLILAGISSAFLLFGMALIYSDLGTMDFAQITQANGAVPPSFRFIAGILMMTVGIGFKLAAVPFQWWIPDVYQGTPLPVAAFITTVSKGAAFALLLRLFRPWAIHGPGSITATFGLLAVASMFLGNLLALRQNNLKRLLAYSSVANMGYLLAVFLVPGKQAVEAATYYWAAYFVTNLAAFGALIALSREDGDREELEELRGIAWRHPWLGGILILSLLSLAGIPLTAGFIGKFYILLAGAQSQLWLLMLILVANSAIGLYYYLRAGMTLCERNKRPWKRGLFPYAKSPIGIVALAILALCLLWFGIYPQSLASLIHEWLGSTL